MCQIYNHSEPVHFSHDLSAERTQTAPSFSLCRRVTYLVVSIMCQCEITYSHTIELPEQSQSPLYRQTIFHADKDGGLAGSLVLQSIIW